MRLVLLLLLATAPSCQGARRAGEGYCGARASLRPDDPPATRPGPADTLAHLLP